MNIVAPESIEATLELHCDLVQAANFYGVNIEEIELKEYITPFSVGPEDSNSAITLQCRGCNELITAHIIEFPKINNFKSSNFLVQMIIIVSIILLPFVRVNISDTAIFALLGFALLIFCYDIYTYMFKPPARLDTPLFWHQIKEIKGKGVNLEAQVEDIELTDEEIWKIHSKLNESKMKILMDSTEEDIEVTTDPKIEDVDDSIISPITPYPDHPNINTPLEDEEIEDLSLEEIEDILESDEDSEESEDSKDSISKQ